MLHSESTESTTHSFHSVPVPMHSPSVVSRNLHDIRVTDGYVPLFDRSLPDPSS